MLRNGPLPDFPTTLPDWRAFAVVLGGVGIRMIIVWARSRRESVWDEGEDAREVIVGAGDHSESEVVGLVR